MSDCFLSKERTNNKSVAIKKIHCKIPSKAPARLFSIDSLTTLRAVSRSLPPKYTPAPIPKNKTTKQRGTNVVFSQLSVFTPKSTQTSLS